MSAEAVLRLDGIHKAFGGLQVLRDVGFAVGGGEIVGLIGPNGAGKSTCFNVVTSIYRPDRGEVRLAGQRIDGMRPDRICRRGVARTFQLVRTFQRMTALQNVMVGAVYGRRERTGQAGQAALDALAVVGLAGQRARLAAHMTLSDRRLLEIARALATQPLVVLLDEPMAGLNAAEIEQLLEVIRRIRDERGVAVLWVEHKVDAIMATCDRVVVLDGGSKIADAPPAAVVADPKVIEAYLGEPVA
ncbi:MAG: ABC transporter ATP-binding protein [Burkholderiales bacterium]|nr:ABC transporter ATP-binding protein [Burkholderiales bacterium]OJX07868.1 MAG: ABC transporter ATP-binding protein [Burkholderiales bacterium 70-64]